MGDRKTAFSGKTIRQSPDHIKIVYDAELKAPNCVKKCVLSFCCCSYLFLRENSIESNVTYLCCFGACYDVDLTNVTYFDRAPFRKTCKPSPFPCCCLCNAAKPKLEVFQKGCYVCCIPIKCGKTAVVKPFETFPVPFCCCDNKVGWWSNCCGFCGPISGNPKLYEAFNPQPKDADKFVEAAQKVMLLENSTQVSDNVEFLTTNANPVL